VSNNQIRQWVAHIHINNGTVFELTVWDTTRELASAQAYRKAGLSGPSDERIALFRLDPASKDRQVTEITPQIPKRDRSKDKRYRVRMYMSPMSRDLKQQVVWTCDADNALWSVMKMFGINSERNLGPFCVEEQRGMDQWVTIRFNQLHTFSERGPLARERDDNYQPAPRTTPSRAEDDGVISSDVLDADWDDAWASYVRQGSDQRREAAAQRFVEKVTSIFDGEKTIPVPKAVVVKE
jgi:hypothetical protein